MVDGDSINPPHRNVTGAQLPNVCRPLRGMRVCKLITRMLIPWNTIIGMFEGIIDGLTQQLAVANQYCCSASPLPIWQQPDITDSNSKRQAINLYQFVLFNFAKVMVLVNN